MKIIVAFLMGSLLCAGFGLSKAVNWTITNYSITANRAVSAPYRDSGLYIENPINTGITLNLKTVASTMAGSTSKDFYPLSFSAGDVVTINTAATQSVNVIWYELND